MAEGRQWEPPTEEERWDYMVRKTAVMWTDLWLLRLRFKDSLSEDDNGLILERLREMAAVLYYHRERLEQQLPPDVYQVLAETASFDQFDALAERVEAVGIEQAVREMLEQQQILAEKGGVDEQLAD